MNAVSFHIFLISKVLIFLTATSSFATISPVNRIAATLNHKIMNPGGVLSVAFSPDGNLVACGGEDTLRVYRAKSGTLVHSFTEQDTIINSVAFSPNGTLLASADDDGLVKIWNLRTGKLDRAIVVHTPHEIKSSHDYRALSVCFSPDGQTLASGSGGFECIDCMPYGEVKLWDVRTGKLLSDFLPRKDYVWSIAFSSAALMATASAGKTVEIWDIRTGKVIRELAHGDDVFPVAYSPNGQYLITGSRDKTVYIWDTQTWKVKRTFRGHNQKVISVAVCRDGKIISAGGYDSITGEYDNIIRVWNIILGGTNSIPVKHQVSLNSIAVSPDCRILAVGAADGLLMLWQLK